jgi:hypothetical protein
MWTPLKLPHFFERMIGFSLPLNRRMVVVSYEGLHLLDLDDLRQIRTDRTRPEGRGVYEPDPGRVTLEGREYSILGLHGGTPRLKSTTGESLRLNLREGTLDVLNPDGSLEFRHPFEDPSGDWGWATFTSEDDFILLGLPYDLHVLKRSVC